MASFISYNIQISELEGILDVQLLSLTHELEPTASDSSFSLQTVFNLVNILRKWNVPGWFSHTWEESSLAVVAGAAAAAVPTPSKATGDEK